MRKEEFFEVLGNLDDELVKEAEAPMKEKINSKAKESLIKSPHQSWRRIFPLALCKNLEIHKVFPQFLRFARKKICSPIQALRFDQRFPKKSGWLKWGAMAACLCVALVAGVLFKISVPDVIIAPGFLTVTAYAASSDEEITMQEGIELPTDYKWSLAMSSRPGLPLKLSAAEYDDLSFEVSVDGGTLLLWEGNKITYSGSSFNTGNDTTVYWTNLSRTGESNFERYMGTTAYINIVIHEEENIVGYAVVEIYTNDLENEPAQTYSAKLLKSVSFPKANGKYQKITAEYVAMEMEQIKSETQTGQR